MVKDETPSTSHAIGSAGGGLRAPGARRGPGAVLRHRARLPPDPGGGVGVGGRKASGRRTGRLHAREPVPRANVIFAGGTFANRIYCLGVPSDSYS